MPLFCELASERCDTCGVVFRRTWLLRRRPDEGLGRYCDVHALDVVVAIGCDYQTTTEELLQEAIRIVERIYAVRKYEQENPKGEPHASDSTDSG